jgi:DNA replication protein DnaC
VIYGTAKELIDNINETPIDERKPVKDRLKQVDILIIDEVGRNSDTDAFRNTLFDIVQYRERDELQTLMATNKQEAEFWNKYLDEAFQRRFEENGIIINF